MSVDFYLPPEGLQGQDIPCHVVWSGLDWTTIEVAFSDSLEIAHHFNTKGGYVKIEAGRLLVFALETDGYLGLVFHTKRLADLSHEAEVRAEITGKSQAIWKDKKTIRLFRPSLEILSVPPSVTVDETGRASAKISLRHKGFGTLMVSIEAADDSEVKGTIPDQLKKALEGFVNDLIQGLDKLEEKYPQYKPFFELTKSFDYGKREEAVARISEAGEEVFVDREFLEDYVNAFIQAMVKNTDFELLVVRPIVDFIKSAIGRGIIFTTPFLEVECDKNPRGLVLEVTGRDLLGVELLKFKTAPFTVSSKVTQRVAIGSLLQWSSEPQKVS